MAKTTKSGGRLMDIMKDSFASGIGFLLAIAVMMCISVALFISGFLIVKKNAQSMPMKVLGYVLMGLGCAVGLGFGGSMLLSTIASDASIMDAV